MTRNMSNIDRIIRVVLAAIFVYLYFAGVVGGALAVILLMLGGVFLLTSIVGFCPLYASFKFSTIKKSTG
ncbi:MAG: DUF2892 domain-containing protein [Anaerolineales bacterium]